MSHANSGILRTSAKSLPDQTAGAMPRIDPVRNFIRRCIALWPFARGAWRITVVAASLFRRFETTGAIGSAGISDVLFAYPPGYISSEAFFLVYEKEIRRLMRRLLRPGSVFVDIGAHRGFHSSLALGLVHPGGRVIACEPRPENADGLRLLASLNPARNLVIEQSAIAGASGSQVLYLSDNHGWNTLVAEYRDRYPSPFAKELKAITVRALTLDDLFQKYAHLGLCDGTRPVVLKIDVEAAEYHILTASPRVLQLPAVKAIILECSGGSSPFEERAIECVRILNANGFSSSVIAPDSIRSWSREDAKKQVNILAERD